MGLSRAVSEIDDDFSRKSQIFPTPVYFAPPLKGFPWEVSIYARRQKKTKSHGATGLRKKFDDTAVWIQYMYMYNLWLRSSAG